MKIKSVLVLLVAGLSIWSCKKDEPQKVAEKITPEQFASVGVQHNEGLDYVYHQLLELKKTGSKKRNKIETMKLVEQYTKDYANQFSMEQEERDFSNAMIHEYVLRSQKKVTRSAELFTKEQELSDKQKDIFRRLNNVISDDDNDIQSLESRIIALEEECAESMSNEELYVIYSATSVAKETLKYWAENTAKWRKMLGNGTRADGDSWWKASAKADVAGAIGGAVGAAGANIIIGPGQVAYGAAIATGAIGGSAASAVGSLLDWLW